MRTTSSQTRLGSVAERQVAQAGVFVVADVVLDAGAAAMIAFELGDRAGLVGEDRLEAVPVQVGERQLRAGVRVLAAHQDARSGWPAVEVDLLGDLKRLRYRLLHVAGRLAFDARIATLRLQTSWPWARDLAAAFHKLRRSPHWPDARRRQAPTTTIPLPAPAPR